MSLDHPAEFSTDTSAGLCSLGHTVTKCFARKTKRSVSGSDSFFTKRKNIKYAHPTYQVQDRRTYQRQKECPQLWLVPHGDLIRRTKKGKFRSWSFGPTVLNMTLAPAPCILSFPTLLAIPRSSSNVNLNHRGQVPLITAPLTAINQ